jgi:signal peptidase II
MTRSRVPYLVLMIAVIVGDQVTKAVVHGNLALHESRTVIGGLVSITYVRNRGAAFGFLSDADLPYQSAVFSLVSLLALGAIGAYAWRLPSARRLPQAALALIMGGAVGNLIDRALLGSVVDFVDVYWGRHHWPAFNLADSSITVGVALLILDILRSPHPAEMPRTEMTGASPAGRTE